MSTNSFRSLIKETVDYISCNMDCNYILIGENTSGKSELLSCIMGKIKNTGDPLFYFIDSVNRSFHLNEIGYSKEEKEFDHFEVCRQRTGNLFNKLDSFGVGKIESIYWMHEEVLKDLIFDFLGLNIDIKVNNQEGSPVPIPAKIEIIRDGISFSEEGECDLNIPNGMQAVIRLFLELLFFKSKVQNDVLHSKAVVFIEELDLYLSENYSSKIFNFLVRRFPEFLFIVSTHSRDLTISAENATVIAIKGSEKRIVNSGENYQLDVEELFADIFHTKETSMHTNDDSTDRKIRILLNKKIGNSWSEEDQQTFNELMEEKLFPHQIFLMEEIKRWKYG